MNILELLVTVQEIGKPLNVKFKDSNLSYTINGKAPREIPIEHYLTLKKKYDEKLYIQLQNKPNKALFDKIAKVIEVGLTSNLREREKQFLSYGFIKVKKQLTDSNLAEHNEIVAILDAQKDILDLMKNQLLVYAELKDFIIDGDFSNKITSNSQQGTGVINYPSIGKATFKLNKKEVATLIYVLEKTNLLEFESETMRNKFIETNFNYTESRKKGELKGKSLPIKDVNSDMSNLKAFHQSASNNKVLVKLKETIDKAIGNYVFDKKPPK